MWYIEAGVDVMSPKNPECFILINVDSKGRELMRAGSFASRSVADTVIRCLNAINVHDANVFAGYLNIDTFLRKYIEEQEKVKKEEEDRMRREEEEVLKEACEWTNSIGKGKW